MGMERRFLSNIRCDYFCHALTSSQQVRDGELGTAAVAKLSLLVCAAPVHVQGTWELGQGRERAMDAGAWGGRIFSARGDEWDWDLSLWGTC